MVLNQYTISALGHVAALREHETSALGRSAVKRAGELLDQRGSSFEARVVLRGFGDLRVNWTSEDYSCALAIFSVDDEVLSADVILSGLRPEADEKARAAALKLIGDFCLSTGETPADGLARAEKRPMVACIRFSTSERKGMSQVRDLELCLAAAFLERAFENLKWLML